MGRPRKKPDYDPKKELHDLLDIVVEVYREKTDPVKHRGWINSVAAELDIPPLKARKLLITAGIRDDKEYYTNPICKQILALHKDGRTIEEIMADTGLSRSTVCCYLPYTKGIYNAKELSLVAERIRRYRNRQERCRTFMSHISDFGRTDTEEYLWDTLRYLEGGIFQTSGRSNQRRINFRYKIKGGEMFINKKEQSITRSTINLAFWKAREVQAKEGYIDGPARLGIFGASYLYPIFLRLGICTRQK